MQKSFQKKAVGFIEFSKIQFNLLRFFYSSISQTNNFIPFFNDSTLKEPSKLHYPSLIRQCIDTKSVSNIRVIQTHILKSGFILLGLGNKLIDAYIKCGSVLDARRLFDEMPQRHIVTWNSIISTYITQKKFKEAIGLYKKMTLDGVFPDEYTFSSIFRAFSEMGFRRDGRKAHGFSIILGLEESNVFVGSALVDMYSKFGKMRDAKLVADKVVDKDVVLFTALIVGYSQHSEDSEALAIFTKMINEGVRANEYTFASILISCGNLENFRIGKLIHGLIIKSGLECVVASQTSLLTMYSKCGLLDDSLKVFERTDDPNQVTWTSLIVGLVQNGREEVGLKKFRLMIRDSINPNSFTLSSVLRACSSLAMLEEGKQIHAIVTKYGLGRDTYSGAALIDLYGKCGSTEMARSVFDELSELDVVSMNTMIYSYAQNGFGNEALKVFHSMKTFGLEPNNITLLSILTACNNSGLVEEGCQIFEMMKQNFKIQLTNDHYACMVDLLGRAGRLEEAEKLISAVKNPDVVLWRTLISDCRIHGNVDMVERIKNKVLQLAPGDEGTHVLLSNLYASMRDWSRVIEMKSKMKEMRLRKDPAMTWVEVDHEVHTFTAGNQSHPRFSEINKTLEELIEKVKILGYVPDTKFVLQDLDEERKERSLYYHSEKLAIAFAIWRSRDKSSSIRIFKNLRVCGDCHSWIKLVSKAVKRDIISRDAKRFHHFKDGSCSCGDYW